MESSINYWLLFLSDVSVSTCRPLFLAMPKNTDDSISHNLEISFQLDVYGASFSLNITSFSCGIYRYIANLAIN